MRNRQFRRGAAAASLAALLCAVTVTACSSSSSDSGISADTAIDAYQYTYPLVSVELSRRESSNVATPNGKTAAPMNQFANLAFLPDASFTSVVRPNVDTLYSSLFFDVSKEPLVISVPDMGDRYNLFPILDMWTNVQASPGTRTLGSGHGYRFAITGPDWHGTLPEGVTEYRMPTTGGWVIGRIQVNGTADIPAVAAIQRQLTAVPLSSYGTAYTPPENTDLHQDWPKANQPVPAYIRNLTPQQYWDLYYSSLSHNQTLPQDKDLLAKLAKAGWTTDRPLDLSKLAEADRKTWTDAWTPALSQIEGARPGQPVNGWLTRRQGTGTYGTDYRTRANVAANGLGGNLPQDSIYPQTTVDGTGARLTSDRDYVLHFAPDQIPQVGGFWSLTMYNDKNYFTANPIDRYAVRGERLTKNPDGSIDIYIQRDTPGPDRENNWLPSPQSGNFLLQMRLYWPGPADLDGSWNPPAVTVAP